MEAAPSPLPAEYGRIAVIKKDGTEGAHFIIHNDITFGREKNSDIRIKLNSVSREHAKISIDENGHVSFIVYICYWSIILVIIYFTVCFKSFI
jgi:hypothetical protein